MQNTHLSEGERREADLMRGALRDGGFTSRKVAQALGFIAWSGAALDSAWWRRSPSAGGALGPLIDVFVRGEDVGEAALVTALGARAHAAGTRLGLIEGGASPLLLLPLGEDLVLMDHPARSGQDDGIFLADSTSWAARRMVLGPAGRHLDLGSGGGAVTLAAARTATETVGLDINPRAATVLALSAALSAVNVLPTTGDARALDGIGTFDRVSFVLPMLTRRVEMADAPVHTLGPANLLESVIDQLPSLLRPQGLAILYSQVVLPGGELPTVLRRAFARRRFRARLWVDWWSDTEVGPVRGGILALRADADGGFDEVEAPPDRPGDDDGSAQLAALATTPHDG